MQTRKLGYTDLHLTTIGLGTWAIGGPWEFGWGPQDDNEAIGAIHAALDNGINWIDTAAIYGLGHSEELVGKALKERTQKPFVATKCGIRWNSQNHRIPCLEAESIRDECHNSLKRLGIDVIDLYQIHWNQPAEDIEQGFEAIAKLAEEGKVRYLGISNFTIEQIKRIQTIAPVASFQPPYSMLYREVEDELLAYCADNDIGVIVYSPMQRGLLTGKFSEESLANLPDDDHRKRSPDFQPPRFGATLELVEQLKQIAQRSSITCAQLAISWTLRRSEVTAAIVGARRPQQIMETVKAGDIELSNDDIEQIEQLLTKWQEKIHGK